MTVNDGKFWRQNSSFKLSSPTASLKRYLNPRTRERKKVENMENNSGNFLNNSLLVMANLPFDASQWNDFYSHSPLDSSTTRALGEILRLHDPVDPFMSDASLAPSTHHPRGEKITLSPHNQSPEQFTGVDLTDFFSQSLENEFQLGDFDLPPLPPITQPIFPQSSSSPVGSLSILNEDALNEQVEKIFKSPPEMFLVNPESQITQLETSNNGAPQLTGPVKENEKLVGASAKQKRVGVKTIGNRIGRPPKDRKPVLKDVTLKCQSTRQRPQGCNKKEKDKPPTTAFPTVRKSIFEKILELKENDEVPEVSWRKYLRTFQLEPFCHCSSSQLSQKKQCWACTELTEELEKRQMDRELEERNSYKEKPFKSFLRFKSRF